MLSQTSKKWSEIEPEIIGHSWEKSIVVKNLIVTDLAQLYVSSPLQGHKIIFENVTFQTFTVSDVDFKNEVHFINCYFDQIEMTRCKMSFLIFKGCQISGGMDIKQSLQTENIEIQNSIFQSLKIHGNSFRRVTIRKTSITATCEISVNADAISIADSRVMLLSITGKSSVVSTQFCRIGHYSIQSSEARVLINTVYIDTRLFTGLNGIKELNLINLNGTGTCVISDEKIENIKVEKSNISSLEFKEITLKKTCIVRDSSFDSLIFNEVLIRSDMVQFFGLSLEKEGMLTILTSDLGKASFVKCDFSRGYVNFENGKLHEIFLAETLFPEHVYSSSSEEAWYEQSQLFFGQLQNAYSKQGDNIRANDYQSREIEAHFKNTNFLIKVNYKPFIWIPRFKRLRRLRNFSIRPVLPNMTWVSLGLNRLSNGFGRRWFRGVLFTFGFGLMFFLFVIWSTPDYVVGWDFKSQWVGTFLRFMNPLRQFNIEETLKLTNGITLTGWSYVWDFLGRIAVAYGYYQTIQAFRRYGKK